MKLDGTSNVWLDEMPVTFTTTGDSLDALTGSVILTIGGNTYTESTGTNCTPTCAANTTAVVVFDNLDLTLVAGSTTNFTVSADLNDIENTGVTATDFDEGDTLLASILTTNRDDIIAENAGGDQLTDGTEMTGSLTGNAQAFYSAGINVALVGTPTAVITHTGDIVGSGAGDDDQATFAITFDVTAFGSDAWIDKTAPTATGGTTESDLDLTATGTAALTSASIAFTSGYAGNSSAITGTNAYKVEQDTTKRFTITAVATVSADGFVKVALTDLLYALTDVDGDLQYTFNLTDFKTQDLFMNAN